MGKHKARANGDGDVFPRRNKEGKITSYRGAYVGPDGKRRYVSGRTKEEARKTLREARAGADSGLVFDGGTVTLSSYLDRWLADSVKDTVRQRTYERYESIVRVHIKPTIGRVKLKALTPAHARALYRQKLDSGLSAHGELHPCDAPQGALSGREVVSGTPQRHGGRNRPTPVSEGDAPPLHERGSETVRGRHGRPPGGALGARRAYGDEAG